MTDKDRAKRLYKLTVQMEKRDNTLFSYNIQFQIAKYAVQFQAYGYWHNRLLAVNSLILETMIEKENIGYQIYILEKSL